MATTVQVSTDEILTYLGNADYPADRDDLIVLAKGNGATYDILNLLSSLPSGEYRTEVELSRYLDGMGTSTTSSAI